MSGFTELGVSAERVKLLTSQGITEPTPIQEQAIPVILQGRDCIGQAQTGTGKTLAFILPMLEKMSAEKPYVQGLIVTPTRELALQITKEVKKLLDSEGNQMRVLAVYGGQDVEAQLKKLKGDVHIIVCTPGRLLDHVRRETVDLSRVSTLVLDEADQMLHMGFLKEVEEVLQAVPYKRQTLLFSATMPAGVRALATRYLRSPQEVTVRAPKMTVRGIKQWAVMTTDRSKQDTLCKILDEQQPFLAMIFCRTKRRAGALNEALQTLGYNSEELHGDLSQAKREQVMTQFRKAKLQFLVATDVAARGLDVEGVTHVFNYDIPHDVESYIHRIGRTGRAGEAGLAITLVAPKDRNELTMIEKGIGQKLEQKSYDARANNSRERDAEERELGRDDRGRAGSRSSRGGGRSGARSGGRSGGRVTAPKSGGRASGRSEGPKTGRGGTSTGTKTASRASTGAGREGTRPTGTKTTREGGRPTGAKPSDRATSQNTRTGQTGGARTSSRAGASSQGTRSGQAGGAKRGTTGAGSRKSSQPSGRGKSR